MSKPSTNGDNGKDAAGKFVAGNKGGPGNPFSRQVAKLRSALLQTVTTQDIIAIVKVLIKKAKKGNVACAKEVLDRSLGKPVETDLYEKLENLEKAVDEFERQSK
jgi:hypothetical protein